MSQKEFDLLRAHPPEKGKNWNNNNQIYNTLHGKVNLGYLLCLFRSAIVKNDKKKPKQNAKSRAKESDKTPKKRPRLTAKSPRCGFTSSL